MLSAQMVMSCNLLRKTCMSVEINTERLNEVMGNSGILTNSHQLCLVVHIDKKNFSSDHNRMSTLILFIF